MTKLLRAIPFLMVFIGLSIVGYFSYDYFGNDVKAENSHERQIEEVKQEFLEATPAPEPTPTASTVEYGVTYATLEIPRFDKEGEKYEEPIMEGTGRDVLDLLGVGHYQSTEQFGQIGNVGLAGHRNGYGSVFDRITELQKGDKIMVTTKDGTYTYVYDRQEKASPSDNDVLLPVPREPGVKPTEQLLTITTCEWWDPTGRVVAYAHLESFEKRK